MQQFLKDVWFLIRPDGLSRLITLASVVVGQVAAQTASLLAIYIFIGALSGSEFFNQNFVGRILAQIIPDASDNGRLIHTGIIAASIIGIASAFSAWAEYQRAREAHAIGRELRYRVVQQVLQRDYLYFLSASPSVITKKVVQDVMIFVQQILLPLLEIGVRALLSATLLLWLLFLSVEFFVFLILFVSVYYFLVLRFTKTASKRVSDGIKQETRESYKIVNQTFSGIKAIIASDLQQFFVDQCDGPSTRLSRLVPNVVLLSSVPKYLLEAVILVGFIAFVLVLLANGANLESLASTIAIFGIIIYRLGPSLQIMMSQVVTITATRQAVEELVEELRAPITATRERLNKPETIGQIADIGFDFRRCVKLDRVTFHYNRGSSRGISDLSLVFDRGAQIGIVGATGSGKSTLLDILLGLLRPSSGNIIVDDQVLDSRTLSGWRQRVGYVPQDQFLIEGTVAENIALGTKNSQIDMSALREVAACAKISSFIEEELPEGYDTKVGERGVSLSGGQRQRLGIARALYRRPCFLVLDEATSALDSLTENAIVEEVQKLEFKPTVVMVSHRLSTVRHCDVIYLLEGGRLEAAGTFEQLWKASEKFRRMVDANGELADTK